MTQTLTLPAASSARAFWLGVAAYLVPTFPIAYVWHLIAFGPAYHRLEIYRDDMVIPFGLAAMAIQGVAFSWLYPRVFPNRHGGTLRNGLLYGLVTD